MKGEDLRKGMKFLWQFPPDPPDDISDSEEQINVLPTPTELTILAIGPVYGANNAVSYYIETQDVNGNTPTIVLDPDQDVEVTFSPPAVPVAPYVPPQMFNPKEDENGS